MSRTVGLERLNWSSYAESALTLELRRTRQDRASHRNVMLRNEVRQQGRFC